MLTRLQPSLVESAWFTIVLCDGECTWMLGPCSTAAKWYVVCTITTVLGNIEASSQKIGTVTIYIMQSV